MIKFTASGNLQFGLTEISILLILLLGMYYVYKWIKSGRK